MTAWRRLGEYPPPVPEDGADAAVVLAAADGFADPAGLAVRADVLAAVGEPEPVRAGGLADLVVRIEAAGHAVTTLPGRAPPRRAGLAALHREGSGRFWLWRRHPQRFPLPTPRDTPPPRLAVMALGALRANGLPRR